MSDEEKITSITVPAVVRDRLKGFRSYPDEALWRVVVRLMAAAEAKRK
jgi:hypothetical protein